MIVPASSLWATGEPDASPFRYPARRGWRRWARGDCATNLISALGFTLVQANQTHSPTHQSSSRTLETLEMYTSENEPTQAPFTAPSLYLP